MKTATPPPRPTVGILPIMTGDTKGRRGIANSGVMATLLPHATAADLRAMARELEAEAGRIEGRL